MTKPTPTPETPPELRPALLEAMMQTLMLVEISQPRWVKHLRKVQADADKAITQTKDANLQWVLKSIAKLAQTYADDLVEIDKVAADLGKCLGRMVK
jgi:hypothetical protein